MRASTQKASLLVVDHTWSLTKKQALHLSVVLTDAEQDQPPLGYVYCPIVVTLLLQV